MPDQSWVPKKLRKKPESEVIFDLKQEHQKALDKKTEDLLKARRNYEAAMDEKEYEMSVKERQLRAELDQQELNNAENIQSLQERYAFESSKTQELHEGKVREMEHYLRTVTANAHREKQQAEEKSKRVAAEHATEVRELNAMQAAKIAEITETRDGRESQLIAEHKQRTQLLQNEVAQVNAALLSRDDEVYQGAIFSTAGLPRNPDNKVRDQFLEIQQLVEALGRLQWKPDQGQWTDLVFQRVGAQHGQRQLRKAVLQDLICPFRVFGAEGSGTADRVGLEQEWNEQCGDDLSSDSGTYIWPAPSVQAERWRYMTIKECREALIKPVPSQWDPRARLKLGFKTNLDALVDALKQELGDIVDLTDADTALIDRLSKKAATTWLEFQMHRCRIVVCLTGSEAKVTSEKIALLQRGSLALTVLPWIGRYGNVDGVDLQRFTMIPSCAGDTLTIL